MAAPSSIDWCCVDQLDPAEGIASLPAYVGCCHVFCAAWNELYVQRAWCRVELLMANAFMRNGDRVFVLEDGFTCDDACEGEPPVIEERVVPLHPADGVLTNEADRRIVLRLQDAALASNAFSCPRYCLNSMTESRATCLWWTFERWCMRCGLIAFRYSRTPGVTPYHKVIPVSKRKT